jgi:hypothetical protein
MSADTKRAQIEKQVTNWLLSELDLAWDFVRILLPSVRQGANKSGFDTAVFWYDRLGKPALAFYDSTDRAGKLKIALALTSPDARILRLPYQTGTIQ